MSYDRSKLKQWLIREEDLRLEAYLDSEGLWTIGVGHLIDTPGAHTPAPRIARINNREAMAFLDIDIEDAEHTLDGWLPGWELRDGPRQMAMLQFAFQLGGRVLTFTNSRLLLLAGDWEKAADNLLLSKWATKQSPARAKRVTDVIRTGVLA